MSTRSLVRTEVETFTGNKLAQYVNEEKGTDFELLVEALVALGVNAVCRYIKPSMARKIAQALSKAIAGTNFYQLVVNALDDGDLSSKVEDIGENDSLKVTTKVYEVLSGSGNHMWYETEVEYQIV